MEYISIFQRLLFDFEVTRTLKFGQVDSPELPETPETMEMTENFTKVTKYLTKFIETFINCLGKISRQKEVRIKFFLGFRVF